MLDDIEKVVDEKIRPYLKEHHGNIKVLGFEDGCLTIKMLGQCQSCLSVDDTVQDIISAELQAVFPEIKEVVLSKDLEPETCDLLRELLNTGEYDKLLLDEEHLKKKQELNKPE